MTYKVTINDFEGPLDLLLHLIKKSDIDICDIKVEEITKQYLEYIQEMQQMDLDIASEYLIMAAELIEMKSSVLLPNPQSENDEYEDDPRERLIKRLLEYKQYKEITDSFKALELERKKIYTKEASDLTPYKVENKEIDLGSIGIDDLLQAFKKFLERKKLEKPIHTKVTKKEYSISERSKQIRSILKQRKKVEFNELFDELNKQFIVVTFLSILNLSKKQELSIDQEDNFSKIYLISKGSD